MGPFLKIFKKNTLPSAQATLGKHTSKPSFQLLSLDPAPDFLKLATEDPVPGRSIVNPTECGRSRTGSESTYAGLLATATSLCPRLE